MPAPGTEAPEGSETVPRIAPPDVWAEAVAAVMTANSIETQRTGCWKQLFILFGPIRFPIILLCFLKPKSVPRPAFMSGFSVDQCCDSFAEPSTVVHRWNLQSS